MYDISIILNVHREGFLVSRTLRSLGDAADFASIVGISTELVIVLDNTDSLTERVCHESDLSAFAAVQVLRVDNRSLGLSRNSGCEVARGRYFSTADADDLVSFNYLVAHFSEAERLGQSVILFPQYLIGFGSQYLIAEYGLEDRMRFLLVDQHPFISRVFFHRSLFDEQCYVHCDLTLGHAYEDWHFNAEAVARQRQVSFVQDTAIYYRQRPSSIMAGNRAATVELETPDVSLFEPDVYLKIFSEDYTRYRSGADVFPSPHDIKKKFLDSQVLSDLTEAANRIDPAVDRSQLMEADQWSCMWAVLEPSAVYYELCRAVHGSSGFTDVFLVPYMIAGGAEKYVLDVIQGLIETGLATKILMLSGEPHAEQDWVSRLPVEVTFIDIAKIGRNLNVRQLDRLAARFIRAAAPSARLHFRASVFAHRMLARHFPQFSGRDITYYRFSDTHLRYSGVENISGWAIEFLTNNISYISRIVIDSEKLMIEDRLRFGPMADRWKVLPAMCELPNTQVEATRVKKRLLWASRISGEKRPELVINLAKVLGTQLPEIALDIYGTTSPGFDIDFSGVNYKGAFSSFMALPVCEYDALIYTSWFDGTPNIVLEAMSVGLPVIAPDVGGIGEVVINGVTGLLLDVPAEVDAAVAMYVGAIQDFYANSGQILNLSLAAKELVAAKHSRNKYFQNIKYIWGGSNDGIK